MQNRKLKTELRLINMESVAVEEVEWLLYPFIPVSYTHLTLPTIA